MSTEGSSSCRCLAPYRESQEQSQRLLDETTAAANCRLESALFEGVHDIRVALSGAVQGKILSGSSLADVAATIAASHRLWAHVSQLPVG